MDPPNSNGPYDGGIEHIDLRETHRRSEWIENGLHPLSNANLHETIESLLELFAQNGTKRSLTQLASHAFLITNILIEQDRDKPEFHLREDVISDEEDPGLAPRLTEYGIGLVLQNNTETSRKVSFLEIVDHLLAIQKMFSKGPRDYPSSLTGKDKLRYIAAHSLLFRQLTSQRFVDGRQYLEKAYRAYKPFENEMDELLGFNVEDVIFYHDALAELTIDRAYDAGQEQLRHTDSILEIEGEVYSIAEEALWVDKETLTDYCDESERFLNLVQRLTASPESVGEYRYPYDLNPLRINPIIEFEKKFMLPPPGVLSFSIAHTFYYDLIDTDVGGEFGDTLGTYLEEWTTDSLRKIFPANEILTNPSYPIDGGEAEADIVLLHDSSFTVIECKSKKLRLETQKGDLGGIDAIEVDLEQSIGEGYAQASRLIDGILDGRITSLKTSDGETVPVSQDEYDTYHCTIVLGESFDSMATQDFARFLDIEPLPYVLDVFDLQVITHVLEEPEDFLRYVEGRIEMIDRQTSREKSYYYPTDIHSADEIDYLGFFIQKDNEFPAVMRDIVGAGDTLRDDAVTQMHKDGEMRYYYEIP